MALCPTSPVAEPVRRHPSITPARIPWVEWFTRARGRRIILLVAGIWLLNAFDLMLTVLAFEQGMLHEENPVGRYLLSLGIPSLVLFKVGLVLLGSYPLLRYRRARITEMAAFLILIAYALLAVHWSACYELYAYVITDGQYVMTAVHSAGAAP